MIRAYWDDSGSGNTDYVVIGGHAGRAENWLPFGAAWRAALAPRRRRLHMRQLRWNSPAVEPLLAKLGGLPKVAGLVPFVGGVRVSDYADLVSGTQHERIMTGYLSALMFATIAFLLHVPSNEGAEIILASHPQYDPHATAVFSGLCEVRDARLLAADGSPKLKRWTFAPSAFDHFLDQADFLSFAAFQNKRDHTSKKAKWSKPILPRMTPGWFPPRDEVRRFVTNIVSQIGPDSPEIRDYSRLIENCKRANRNARATV